jgi:hypothetical protein
MNNPSNPPPLPDWAIEHARASLRIGMSVPEIQQRLVSRGLAPAAAEAVVLSVVEDRVRQQVEPQERALARRRLHRILSGIVGAACILLGYWFGGGLSAGKVVLSILFPLSCIWFGDEIGSRWSSTFSPGPTPGVLLRLGGWVVLLGICLHRLALVLASP